MTDTSVRLALRSDASLVVIEAPAGCGKTYQGALYAADVAPEVGRGRVLILTHTHTACDVFAKATRAVGERVEIRTLDSLIAQIAGAYHLVLGLPLDVATWTRSQGNEGHARLATKVATFLAGAPNVVSALVRRYPIIICDEHQDCSVDQHSIVMALHADGAKLRVFGDPMQRLYGRRAKSTAVASDLARWQTLVKQADRFERLDTPHRWSGANEALGVWVLEAREALARGEAVNVPNPRPSGLVLITCENEAVASGQFSSKGANRSELDHCVRTRDKLLVLSSRNRTVASLRGHFNRTIPIWEGHTRKQIPKLLDQLSANVGDPNAVADAAVDFIRSVSTGFDLSFSRPLLAEVTDGCAKRRRGKPAALQALAQLILDAPDHVGVGRFLVRLNDLRRNDSAFKDIKIDYPQEYWDAVRLGAFADAELGWAEIARRRTHLRPRPPDKALSTIHKAKGYECDHAVILPCDAPSFAATDAARCRLYVALSRAKRTLTIVVSDTKPSPLLALA